ncbi:MAG: U32 family peptidase [Clostridiales bacterium]|nr:U32 family peptidase [Clostridiales bacterium]
MRIPELLSPAGDREKFDAALRYGADAVYLAGKRFGMRAASGNFTADELRAAVSDARALGKKVYLTLNILPRDEQYEEIAEFLSEIADIPFDAFIVASPGVIRLIKKKRPDAAIHVSTQASVVSSYDCEAYKSLGASRVVLARELSLEQIKRLREDTDIELEVFVHGSMCVSYSGLCLLSEHLCGRDANQGACAQSCRWEWALTPAPRAGVSSSALAELGVANISEGEPLFEIEERKHKGERYPIAEDEYGTFIMSCRDLCMIEHIADLAAAGIDSLKIEGRVKSAYYTAVTTNAYRIALDDFAAGRPFDPALLDEVKSVSHRDLGTGHFYGRAEVCEHEGYLRDCIYLAVAASNADAFEPAKFFQRNKAVRGMKARLVTPGKTGQPFVFGDIFDENGEPINSTPHAEMVYYTTLPYPVRRGDILRGEAAGE